VQRSPREVFRAMVWPVLKANTCSLKRCAAGSRSRLFLSAAALPREVDLIEMPEEIFASAVTTESPQGIAALVRPKAFLLEDALRGEPPLVVVAAGLQDPGNLGTLIRSAEAFGSGGVVLLPGTVSPWNPKAMRASSGSVFRLPVVAASEDELFTRLRAMNIPALAAVADEGISATKADLAKSTALLLGNEGRGLSAELLAQASAHITIPCPGPVESLNAAVAGSILLYEAARQRSATITAVD
jgi:RNA methyltransferase, TrmH family